MDTILHFTSIQLLHKPFSEKRLSRAVWTIILLILAGFTGVHGQVGINSDNSAPDNSAMLDVKSVTQGLLVPRMTAVQRQAISSPAKGLLVFSTDNNEYYTNKGTPAAPNWVMISSHWLSYAGNIYYNTGHVGIGTSQPMQKLHVNGKITAEYGTTASASFRFDNGSENTGFSSPEFQTISFITNGLERMRLGENGTLAVGTTTPQSSAIVEVASNNRGFLPPRMTTLQMNAIASPVEGLTIYNTTLKTLCWFDGSAWTHSRDGKSCGSVTYSGKTYETVIVGLQCWMKENLNVGTRINGGLDQTNNGIPEKYCYNDLESNCDAYGGLYQWDEVMNYTTSSAASPSGRQGICPAGWHLPSNEEWCMLETYLDATTNCTLLGFIGTDAGGQMKEAGTAHWQTPNSGASNSSGLTLVGGGYRIAGGSFSFLQQYGYLWSATETSATYSNTHTAAFLSPQIYKHLDAKNYGLSARCCKD